MTPDILYKQSPTSSAHKTSLPPQAIHSVLALRDSVHVVMVGTRRVPLSSSSGTELWLPYLSSSYIK